MRKFGVTILQNLRPRWNLAPSQQALVISRNGLQNEAMMAQWGMPPASAKHSFLINARSETVQDKPTFREAFHHRRCLVVASGWYEWSAPKTPWHIQLDDGGGDGIWRAAIWSGRSTAVCNIDHGGRRRAGGYSSSRAAHSGTGRLRCLDGG